jgi:hypothetical protein
MKKHVLSLRGQSVGVSGIIATLLLKCVFCSHLEEPLEGFGSSGPQPQEDTGAVGSLSGSCIWPALLEGDTEQKLDTLNLSKYREG